MVLGKVGVAVCTLNQHCLDFESNLQRILSSIEQAIDFGASIRIGPELEVTGYGCEDAFYEMDTVYHSWQVIAEILKKNYRNILINIGMPVVMESTLYNCIVAILNSKIVYIRAKNRLAINGNYREDRWFSAWGDGTKPSLTWFKLPSFITDECGQKYVPFGDAAILEISSKSLHNYDLSSCSNSFRIGYEICEELWQPDTQNSGLYGKMGCHLVINISGSYWELRKLDSAYTHATSATSKSGGVYAYVNNIGCDGGGRLCCYGRSFVIQNGKLLALATRARNTLFDECEISMVYIDPNTIHQYRLQRNIRTRSYDSRDKYLSFKLSSYENISNDIKDVNVISIEEFDIFKNNKISNPINLVLYLTPEEEIMRYCCLWLWDYLRRCIPGGLKGFILPLSGGLDSCSVACIVYCLCQMLHYQIYTRKNQHIIDTIKPIFDVSSEKDPTPKTICNKLLRCCYLQTQYSSEDSSDRAKNLAAVIGADFHSFNFSKIYKQIVDSVPLGLKPANPGEVTLQQQNVQARLRMVLTYYMSECNRLVLASGNVDEALVGYLTKYDCSSADLNPIGSISKNDLKKFVIFCKQIIPESDKAIDHIVNATPSAELSGQSQKDEDDLGLTYNELSLFGQVRRGQLGAYGPYGMFCTIWDMQSSDQVHSVFGKYPTAENGKLDPMLLATKIKLFFTLYSRNRHKQTILTPALHTETYSPDDNRFDHRQFLFNTKWPWQFKQIDQLVVKIQAGEIV